MCDCVHGVCVCVCAGTVAVVAVLDLCNLFAFIFGLVVGDENSKEPIPVMVSFGASTLAWFVFVYHVARACKEKVRAPNTGKRAAERNHVLLPDMACRAHTPRR